MIRLDVADALILSGLALTGLGLLLIAWPLAVVLAGLVLTGIGWRRLP